MSNCGLDNIDCPVCGNLGYVAWNDNGILRSKECECMEKRRTKRRMVNSGLEGLLQAYTFSNYKQTGEAQKMVFKSAKAFIADDDAKAFIIYGRSGSGKTHICTAMCNEFMLRGERVKYMLWRKEAAELKAFVNDPSYMDRVNELRDVPVLYIDDFYKGTVTDADINLAFLILNDRYNSRDGRKTIISTELPMPKIINLDEATGGRIAEMADKYRIHAPDENWRTK